MRLHQADGGVAAVDDAGGGGRARAGAEPDLCGEAGLGLCSEGRSMGMMSWTAQLDSASSHHQCVVCSCWTLVPPALLLASTSEERDGCRELRSLRAALAPRTGRVVTAC